MNLKDKLNLLRRSITEAFMDVQHPKGNLAPHDCAECQDLRKTFANKNWKNIDRKIIEKNYDQLPLFSAEAFHYFLPSYLIYSLENFNNNFVLEFTIYALNPSKKDLKGSFEYWKERFQYFSIEQMETIYQFLAIIDENQDYLNRYERISIDRLKSVRDQPN